MPKPIDVTLPGDCEIEVVRTFDAPVQLVWDCHTRPELVQRWLYGPGGWSMPYCTIDLSVGGRYRYVWRHLTNGREFGSFGRHREIAAPHRLVFTEEMDGLDGRPMNVEAPIEGPDPSVNTLDLTQARGRTTLRLNMRYPSKAVRDMALQSGMTDGMGESYDRLDAVAAEAGAAETGTNGGNAA